MAKKIFGYTFDVTFVHQLFVVVAFGKIYQNTLDNLGSDFSSFELILGELFEVRQAIDKIVCEASVTFVLLDNKTMKPLKIDGELKAHFSKGLPK